MGDPQVVVMTHALSYAGPGVLAASSRAPKDVFLCHDPAFADESARTQFMQQWPGVLASSASTPEALIEDALQRFAKIDKLISNDVGPALWTPLEEGDAVDLREALETMVVWPYRLLTSAALAMKERGEGRIVVVTSAAPLHPAPGFVVYASARAAASAMARAAAKELAPQGIQINAVAPNFLESAQYYPNDQWSSPQALEQLRERVPMARLGRAIEIGELILFLLSGRTDFVTGEVINFTGGWS